MASPAIWHNQVSVAVISNAEGASGPDVRQRFSLSLRGSKPGSPGIHPDCVEQEHLAHLAALTLDRQLYAIIAGQRVSPGQGDRFEDAQPSCIDHLKQHAVSLGGAAHPSPIVGGGAGELRPVPSDFSAYGSAIGTDEDRVLARLSLAPTRDLAIPGAERGRHPGQHGEAQQGGHNRSHDHSLQGVAPPEEEEHYRTEATT